MQAASAVQVTIQRFGVWNIALGLISATAMSVVAAWLVRRNDDLPGWGCIALIASGLFGVIGVIDLARWRPIVLRWDAQRWRATDPSGGAGEIDLLELRVVLDLGSWMLLKFNANVPQRRIRGGWIPVQRQGLESHWQSLRCAVYARSAAAILPTARDRQAPHG
jgi:hypothetical protein